MNIEISILVVNLKIRCFLGQYGPSSNGSRLTSKSVYQVFLAWVVEPEPLLTTARCSGVLIRIIHSLSLEANLFSERGADTRLPWAGFVDKRFGSCTFWGPFTAYIGLNRSLLEPGPCSWAFHWFFAVVHFFGRQLERVAY